MNLKALKSCPLVWVQNVKQMSKDACSHACGQHSPTAAFSRYAAIRWDWLWLPKPCGWRGSRCCAPSRCHKGWCFKETKSHIPWRNNLHLNPPMGIRLWIPSTKANLLPGFLKICSTDMEILHLLQIAAKESQIVVVYLSFCFDNWMRKCWNADLPSAQ